MIFFMSPQGFVKAFRPTLRAWDTLLASFPPTAAASGQGNSKKVAASAAPSTHMAEGGASPGSHPCLWMIDSISQEEKQAERSLMHRYDTAHKLVERAAALDPGAGEEAEGALKAILMWLR